MLYFKPEVEAQPPTSRVVNKVSDLAGTIARDLQLKMEQFTLTLTCFIATPPDRGWQRSEGLLLLHSFLSLDILVAFSMLRFGTSAKSVS